MPLHAEAKRMLEGMKCLDVSILAYRVARKRVGKPLHTLMVISISQKAIPSYQIKKKSFFINGNRMGTFPSSTSAIFSMTLNMLIQRSS